MKPTEFYQDTYEGVPHKEFYNGTSKRFGLPLAYLNEQNPPSNNQIYEREIARATSLYQNKTDKELINWLNSLNTNEIPGVNGLSYNEVMEIIEDTFYNDLNGSGLYTASKLRKDYTTATKTQEEWDDILNNLKAITKLMRKTNGFQSITQYKKLYKLIQAGTKKLDKDIQGGNTNQSSRGYFSTGKNALTVKGINNLGNRMKGRITEIQTNEFIHNNLPDKWEVMDTANIHFINGDTSGRPDSVIFNLDNQLKINWKINGKNRLLTLGELNEVINKNANAKITVDATDWENILIKSSSAGIQTKSGLTQNPFNGKTFTLNELYTYNSISGKVLKSFSQWYELGKTENAGTHANIYANRLVYDAYFNYALQHFMNRFIKQDNQLLSMRGKIYTVRDYFKNQWSESRAFMRTASPVDISNPGKSLVITVSNKEATFGKQG